MLSGALRIGHHIAVPQANDFPPLPFEHRCPLRIISHLLMMLPAVELDRQFRGTTRQIDDVTVDHQLPGERRTVARQ